MITKWRIEHAEEFIMELFASIASADPLNLAFELNRLSKWPRIHFDIEDGNFTPNLTFGQKTLAAVGKAISPRRLDVHLMTTDPFIFLEPVRECGAESVCAHREALDYPLLFLNRARALGLKAGLALNPGIPLETIAPYLDAMDYLLVMTSEPDGKGEQLNPAALAKAESAARAFSIPVIADGGLNQDAVKRLKKAGAAGCVLGRLIFSAENPLEKLKSLLS